MRVTDGALVLASSSDVTPALKSGSVANPFGVGVPDVGLCELLLLMSSESLASCGASESGGALGSFFLLPSKFQRPAANDWKSVVGLGSVDLPDTG